MNKKRERQFNNAGPSVEGDHYMIDPLARIDLPEVETLIDRQRYFVLLAPRQTGKTTCLLPLMHHLNDRGGYAALYVNVEVAQTAQDDISRGIAAITSALAGAAQVYLKDNRPYQWRLELLEQLGPDDLLRMLLVRWSQALAKPLGLMFDEVDALVGNTLTSLLRQIRAGIQAQDV